MIEVDETNSSIVHFKYSRTLEQVTLASLKVGGNKYLFISGSPLGSTSRHERVPSNASVINDARDL